MIANTLVDIWTAHNTGPISKYEDDIHIGRQPIQTISKHTQPSSSNKNLTHDLPTIPATSTLSTPPFNISAISPTLIAEDDDNIYIYKYDKGIMMDRIRKLNTPWHVLKGDVTFVWIHNQLPSMSNFMVTFKGNQGKKLHVPEAMIKDLIWWKKQLSNSFYYCQLQPLPHVVDLGVYVDASTDWGISIVIGQEWAAFQLIPDWKSQLPDWDICWLETIVVEFTLLFLIAKGYSNTRLLVRSDNQGTIGTFIKAHSTNKWINLFICRMTESLNSSANRRIYEWKSPYSICTKEDCSKLWQGRLCSLSQAVLESSLEPSTASTYGAGLRHFYDFCDLMNIDEEKHMPADKTLITAFVGFFMGTKNGGTIKSWLSSLHAWHILNDAPWKDHDWLKLAHMSANKAGSHCKRDPQPPTTRKHLIILKHSLDLKKPQDAAIYACATSTLGACQPQSCIKTWHGCYAYNLRLPWTKSTWEEGRNFTFTSRPHDSDAICPVDSMDNHLIVNADISLTFPFFTYMGDDSKPKPLTKKEFLDACSKIWREAGMPPIKGHSFQIGRAVELLLVGVSPETVAKIRGWDSLAFLLYWRKCEEILPALTTDAYQKQALENLITTINAWADHLTMSATEFA
ncbi:tyrosine recombinase [Moniliophthora roreri MCA 2997]|uniref:Tyrosine recombinase n=1 Tax=Moniliophthora roreri (strain MCA 2997) TaxID=1381753 RepID=V2YBV3_MONRO|nr:tyrosine recombinase [Moniliophthora roreri MCA 2997]